MVIFEELFLNDDFGGFDMVTHRATESFSAVSSVHTRDLIDFPSKTEHKFQGGTAASTMLGIDVASAYDKIG